MKVVALLFRPAVLLAACAAFVLPQAARAAEPPSRKLVEIYRIAPGRHLEFLQMIAKFDEASKAAGIPPRDLYVHQDGADWDFLLIQDAEHTDEQSAKLGEAMTRLGLPRGAHFFIEFRRNVAEHSDTFVEGPTTAGAWLEKLK
ncbi:MAG TPA: hypothetical protein VNS57_09575 [Steroidobacteraceae bacterium]|nr:hypothetical protein [Steroidobacteraceae bacterium]